jgi:hypothetical protein
MQSIIIRRREIDDSELLKILVAAVDSGDTNDFFGRFEYFDKQNPFHTLVFGEQLLSKCQKLDASAYEKLHKGTPFYWLTWAAFEVHDYETAAFYIDAAVSEDLRGADRSGQDPTAVPSPALLFFMVDDSSNAQALQPIVQRLRGRFDTVINGYGMRPGAYVLSFADVQSSLLRRALLKGNGHLRTLVTALISYILEWDHRSDLLKLRTEQGTAEPFYIHLFKGCVLFESLLKANTHNPPAAGNDMLGRLLTQLQSDLGFAAKQPSYKDITHSDFPTIVSNLKIDDDSLHTAIVRTAQIRNTTGHNLGWQVALSVPEYNKLAGYVASSCLHAIASLYK